MLYTTPIYLPFLALAVGVYWSLVRPEWRKHYLGVVSVAWLAFVGWRSALGLLALSVAVYWVSALVATVERPRVRAWLVGLGLVVPLAYLATFKYLPAYSPPIAALLGRMTAGGLLLPLGVSYFTFKFVHYVIESRRGTLPRHTFWDFLGYVSLFTIFPAGPIERFGNLAPQMAAPRFDGAMFSTGLERILHGLLKKVVVADLLLAAVIERLGDVPSNYTDRSSIAQVAWLGSHLLYLYCDFSGYSDIAIGTSRLFGLRVMENFDWPFARRNLSEFWRSWHMSLTSWCRDYIYFPVFGLTRNPKLSVYASMVVLGYWHGAHPKWLLWGAWHASGLAVWQVWQTVKRRRPAVLKLARESRAYHLAAWALTMSWVVLGGVWTAFDNPLDSLRYLLYILVP